jgi:hypothetical protein
VSLGERQSVDGLFGRSQKAESRYRDALYSAAPPVTSTSRPPGLWMRSGGKVMRRNQVRVDRQAEDAQVVEVILPDPLIPIRTSTLEFLSASNVVHQHIQVPCCLRI